MKRTSRCPSCGWDLFPDDAFCSRCGTRVRLASVHTGLARRTEMRGTIPPQGRVECASCNSPLLPSELFCPVCGARSSITEPDARMVEEARAAILRKLEEATRGEYTVIRELGRGGMGSVYLARELGLDRLVAIKVLSSAWLTDEAMVERFKREARTIAAMRHPSIVHVHGVGKADDLRFFVMDFIEGVSLGQLLRTHGPLSIRATSAVFQQVGSALSYAHGRFAA